MVKTFCCILDLFKFLLTFSCYVVLELCHFSALHHFLQEIRSTENFWDFCPIRVVTGSEQTRSAQKRPKFVSIHYIDRIHALTYFIGVF